MTLAICILMFVLGIVGIYILNMVHNNIAEPIGIIIMIVSLVCGFIGFLGTIVYPVAYNDAKFLNSNFGTKYTAEDMFWHGEDIKTMIIGNKVRAKVQE